VSTTRLLLDRLLDDAAMFPPGNASAADALGAHLTYRSAWYAEAIGPLLVHVDRWSEFVTALDAAGDPTLEVVVLGTAERPTPIPPQISIVGCELAAPADVAPLLEAGGPVAVEVLSLDDLKRTLDLVAEARAKGLPAIVKYRTGGTSAAAFPAVDEVAGVLAAVVERRLPMKFTAGLHHAVRHTDPDTGFEHHGFLNLMVAAHAAGRGSSPFELEPVLDQRDGEALAATVRAWDERDAALARDTFTSFGCCGVLEPIHDLLALGLLHEGHL
jgi:hypothetical protein